MTLVLHSGGVTRLARRSAGSLAMIEAFRREGLWPPLVPSIVLVECVTGKQRTDANVNRFLKTCEIVERIPQPLARRAALLRSQAQTGSAVDALVAAFAEPDGDILGGDLGDLRALATYAVGVRVHRA